MRWTDLHIGVETPEVKSPRFRRGDRAPELEEPVADPDEPSVPDRRNREIRQFALDPATIKLRLTDVVRPAPGVTEEIGEHVVAIVDASGVTTHALNHSASLIWLSLDGEASLGRVLDELHAETGAPPDVLSVDVLDTVARFVASGIAVVDR